jgi:hypothetical protein
MTTTDDDDDDFGPGDPDFDLSEAHGYTWEPARDYEGPVPRWLITLIAIVVVLALLVPGLIFILDHL